ncbi:hypothetical protein BaRGS_00030944 [Batillaria attramentaria]|uniref:Uncharacterized protein n=1 Tax=Batillaria attramentaria TaxID=370345 RepID=A0ABD0JSA3_9CAEN
MSTGFYAASLNAQIPTELLNATTVFLLHAFGKNCHNPSRILQHLPLGPSYSVTGLESLSTFEKQIKCLAGQLVVFFGNKHWGPASAWKMMVM